MTREQMVKWLPSESPEGDEEVVLFLRRHRFVLFVKYLFLFVLALLPLGVYLLLLVTNAALFSSESASAIAILALSLYYLFIWIIGFVTFIDYYLDVWLVTTHRIVDREQKGLFNVTIAEQSLEMVQDVSSKVKGVFPTLLDYGDVLIQSAAAQSLFRFKQIPDPDHVAREVTRLAADFRDHHRH